ncbi:MAG: sodium:proton antiporter [Alistipes sp.]|nr:sodium:proton antiporter [Alistipes sp.]MBQ5922940.1 sodium:proton antiporter [Alistipes sp.]
MQQVELWALIPFVLMLLSIAVLPIVKEHWWENNTHKLYVSLLLALPAAIYLLANNMGANLEHQILFDYIPFIVLLGALFVVTGGIHIRGDIQARPINNTLIMFVGFLLASFIGTTGAAMLTIRLLLEVNQQRKYKVHTILFFIALVANCGGVLTPLGDPPLFLLYLRGAEFGWFMNLLPEWAFVGAILLVLHLVIDYSFYYRKEQMVDIMADVHEKRPITVTGKINIIYLVGIILAVSFLNPSYIPAMGDHHAPLYVRFLREIVLVAIGLMSWFTTKKSIRLDNKYSWEPIIEVAYLFIGIFVTMTPALIYLNVHAADLGLSHPWQFFYASGFLSAFLDNSPTAVAFHTVAQGLPAASGAVLEAGIDAMLLRAIALGSVFFGAMTYIGNGPNFMVKAIAEQAGVNMPSFFGYMIKFSLVVLLPIYIVAQLIFL